MDGIRPSKPFFAGSTPAGGTTFYKGTKMKRIIEIRAAEGGEDSKLFVKDLAAAYIKHFTRVG